MKLIDGRLLAEKIKDQIVSETRIIANSASIRRPNLAIVLVGGRTDSQLYVSLKEKEGVKLGVDTNLYRLDEDIKEKELLEVIDFLNKDDGVDGILIQLPLPERLNVDTVIGRLEPLKDADGFHPRHPDYVVSPVLAAIEEILKDLKVEVARQNICVLHNSLIFGQETKKALTQLGCSQVNLVSAKDWESLSKANKDQKMIEFKNKTRQADILISALGLPKFINQDFIKEGATLIDIGISEVDGKVIGDIDAASVSQKAAYLTPVPGGIGPMTIALLFRNVLNLYKNNYRL